MDKERIDALFKLGEEIKKREDKMSDIRPREWMNLDTNASKILRLLIEAEDLLTDFYDYQNENNQCYPDFEEFYNQVSNTRHNFAKYIDEHKELLTMDDEIEAYFQNEMNDINK